MEGKPGRQERLHIKVRLATPEDWEAYKNLRMEAITGPDAGVFGPKSVARDKEKTDDEWKEVVESWDDAFVVLAMNKNQAIGIGTARDIPEEKKWHLGSAYIKPEFRGKIDVKMIAFPLAEILKRGGTRVEIGTKVDKVARFCESLGFKKVDPKEGWQMLELDLTDPVIIDKINTILHAG